MTRSVVRVGIIGAGASGLVALKQLLEIFSRHDVEAELDVVVYEKNNEVGGVWHDDGQVKTSRVEFDSGSEGRVISDKDPSPMYEGLHTNLPHDLMSFRDHFFPDDTPTFPTADQVQAYLVSYSDHFELRPYIQFNTHVQRLHKDQEEWIIETSEGTRHFDRIIVANGHYADTFVPPIPGLSTFPGKITHSRYYRNPKPYIGHNVLVVGSFASGSDLARLIASSNLPSSDSHNANGQHKLTKVYVSSEGDTSYATREGEWARFVTDYPLIQSIEKNRITFTDGQHLDDIDTIIFATGYHYALPFCHKTDKPWNSQAVLDQTNREGGLRGLYMSNLDPLLLFLKDDTSIAFPVLQYQIVPFPLAEAQARLISYLWSNLIPSLPEDLSLPPNPNAPNKDSGKTRKVVKTRKEFVFGSPFEWSYEEYLMDLCLSADDRLGTVDSVPDYWKRIEGWRRDRRNDKDLRKRTLGY